MDEMARPTRPHRAMLRRIEPLLGPIAAVLLGFAAGFFCFAMPARIVSALIGGMGLPPAVAESRLGLAVAVALLAGGATWVCFRWLDRLGVARPAPASLSEADAAPVLRRADAHPDAPPRRPIFAGSDLGTPLDLVDPLPADWQAIPPQPFPDHVERPEAEVTEGPLMPAAASPEVAPPEPIAETVAARSAPKPSLAAMMGRLELSLARKALALGGEDSNVTPLKREIRPIGGSLRDALDEIQQRTARRR